MKWYRWLSLLVMYCFTAKAEDKNTHMGGAGIVNVQGIILASACGIKSTDEYQSVILNSFSAGGKLVRSQQQLHFILSQCSRHEVHANELEGFVIRFIADSAIYSSKNSGLNRQHVDAITVNDVWGPQEKLNHYLPRRKIRERKEKLDYVLTLNMQHSRQNNLSPHLTLRMQIEYD